MNPTLFAVAPILVVAAAWIGFECGKLSGAAEIRGRVGKAIAAESENLDANLARQYETASAKALIRFGVFTALRRVADAVRDEKAPR